MLPTPPAVLSAAPIAFVLHCAEAVALAVHRGVTIACYIAMQVGYNPFYGNSAKTFEPWLLTEFPRVRLLLSLHAEFP
jgi:hypothetical protein